MRQCRQGGHRQRWKEQPIVDKARQSRWRWYSQKYAGRANPIELLTGCRHEDQQGCDQPCAPITHQHQERGGEQRNAAGSVKWGS